MCTACRSGSWLGYKEAKSSIDVPKATIGLAPLLGAVKLFKHGSDIVIFIWHLSSCVEVPVACTHFGLRVRPIIVLSVTNL